MVLFSFDPLHEIGDGPRLVDDTRGNGRSRLHGAMPLHELAGVGYIWEACRLLLETDRPVTEIVLDAGFNNLSNFNRRFRELKNLSPREFRSRFSIGEPLQKRPLPASR